MQTNVLEINKNELFSLNAISGFKIEPKVPYQLILGTNGSGKTTLLRKFLPSAPNKSEFLKGGNERHEFTHRKVHYILDASFEKASGHYSFVADGVEQNEGGTYSVQKKLIEQQFGLTDELVEMLAGDIEFHRISPTERRRWLTRMANTDMKYALRAWNDFKGIYRDKNSALKYVNGQLAQELKKVNENTDWDQVNKRIKDLKSEIESISESIERTDRPAKQILHLARGSLNQINRLLNESNQLIKDFRLIGNFTDYEDLETKTNEQSSEEIRLETEFEQLNSQLLSLQEFLEQYVVADQRETTEELHAKVEYLEHQISELDLGDFKVDNVDKVIDSLDYIQKELITIGDTIPNNSTGEFTRQAYVESNEQRNILLDRISKLNARIRVAKDDIEHIDSVHTVDCPECRFRFKPGIGEDAAEKLKKRYDELQVELKEATKELEELEEWLDVAGDYIAQIKQYRTLVSEHNECSDFWRIVNDMDLINKDAASISTHFASYARNVHAYAVAENYRLEIRDIKVLIKAREVLNTEDYQGALKRKETLLKEIEDKQKALENNRKLGDHYRQMNTLYLKYLDNRSTVVDLTRKLETDLKEYNSTIRNETLINERTVRAEELSDLERKVMDHDMLSSRINDYKNQISTLEIEVKAAKLTVDSLCPKFGLIADQMSNFVTVFTEQMNEIIAQIWTYDLKIRPCENDKGALDFIFPYSIPNKKEFIQDIRKGSRAQRAIFDFAFRLMVYRYMDLQDYPLIADELGDSFDEEHRERLMWFLKKSVERGDFNRLYFISHYAALHGVFVSPEICVLDDSNIMIPQKTNTHVEFS